MAIQKIIPSYLYSEYADDEDLQAFIRAYNEQTQEYLDWFNSLNLPVYPNLTGSLLDWVGAGLYGMPRPVLPSGTEQIIGPLNTYPYNTLPYDSQKLIGPLDFYSTSDDVYIRVLTWHFYKGDGKYFNIQWLKRRIARFLFGPNFDPAVLYQISVTFGTDSQVNINILNGERTNIAGAIPGTFAYNTQPYDNMTSSFSPVSTPILAPVMKAAIDFGVLELPFQYTYVVNI